MSRSILAVVVGYLTWTVVWLGGGAAIRAFWPAGFPEAGPWTATAPLVALLGLSLVCSLAAGLVAARLAPTTRAVAVMSVLLLLTGIGVQASVWALMPLWFHLAFLALIVPACRVGAGWSRAGAVIRDQRVRAAAGRPATGV
jgi:hypothetical protein